MRQKLLSILALLCITASSAWGQTTADVGKVIAADGKIYKTVAAAENAGTTASGVIVYVGSAGSVNAATGEDANASSYKCLAMSLGNIDTNKAFCTDCGLWHASGSYGNLSTVLGDMDGIGWSITWGRPGSRDYTGDGHTHNHAPAADVYDYATARPDGASRWFIPSMGQWNLIAKSLTGKSTDLAETDNSEYSQNALNAKITPSGASGLTWAIYWSVSEQDGTHVWCFDIGGTTGGRSGSRAISSAKNTAQYMYTRAFFAFASATAAVYTISYDANGGSGAPAAQTKDGGIDLDLSSDVPTREGYTFDGWATSADGAVAYSAGGSYTTDNDVVLYAQWTPIASYNVTANSASEAYWATFYSNAGNYQAAEGTQVFTVHLEGTGITMNEVGDRIAKSGQGVVLRKTTTGDFTMTLTETAPAGDFSGNSLTGTMTVINTTGANDYYVLGGKSGAGFYKLSNTSGTIGANKAYLTYSGGGSAAARGFFLFDETTGIEMATAEDNVADAVVFDLQGRRVLNPTKGLYIVNGKKVFINK